MTLRDAALLLVLAGLYLTASTTEPRDVSQGRTGTITHMGAGYPASYLALPIGAGHRVRICGPARCLTLTSTDAGPDRAMLQAGRIADVSVQTFESLCGCPSSRGTFQGSWKLVGPSIPLPETSTEDES